MVFLLQLIAGAIHLKLGFSGMNLTPEQTKGTLKVCPPPDDRSIMLTPQLILAIIVVYKMTVTLIKLSILMIYLRLCTRLSTSSRAFLTYLSRHSHLQNPLQSHHGPPHTLANRGHRRGTYAVHSTSQSVGPKRRSARTLHQCKRLLPQ
jgi:hypothetical protein